MKKAWTTHCKTTQQKEEFIERLTYTQDMFLIMKDMLETKLEEVRTSRRSLKSFLTQNWAAYQADRNATERTLLEVIDLLPILGDKP